MNNPVIDPNITQTKTKNVVGETSQKVKGFFSKIWEQVPTPIKGVFARFYANKKIFWPITIAFGLVFLIIVLGLLFGSRRSNVILTTKKTPPPFVLTTPVASPSGDILTVTENQLKDLNDQINSLDIVQNKLKPPEINYNISF